MSRQESDREDLMREAAALVRRVELALPGRDGPLVAGWRAGGELSLYFGPDPVYHFDATGRLRRAFAAGDLYRTQGTTLARLTRHRTPTATELRRHDLTSAELADFLAALQTHLRDLHAMLVRGDVTVLRQIPENASLPTDLRNELDQILTAGPTLAPAIKGKR